MSIHLTSISFALFDNLKTLTSVEAGDLYFGHSLPQKGGFMTTFRIFFSTAVLLLVLGFAIISGWVAQAAGPVFGPPPAFSTNATTDPGTAQCNGNMGVRPYFPPGQEPPDITGLRYKFHVSDNIQADLGLKILFGFIPLYTPEATRPYSLESNLYTLGLHYEHSICTTWPLEGTRVSSETSLRLAVPDYAGLGKTGAKTFDPSFFPLQSYLIDNLPIPKTDAISQLNLNQATTEVVITRRPDLVSDNTGWRRLVSDNTGWKCVDSLDDDTYRQWDASATVGATTYNVAFALPDSNASFISPGAPIIFRTEFFLFSGIFKVYLWDFEFIRESTGFWEPLTQWIVDDQCGDDSAYGVRLASFKGRTVMEISNDETVSFLPVGTIFDLSSHSCCFLHSILPGGYFPGLAGWGAETAKGSPS